MKIRPYVPAGAVRADSIDEDISDDVDDDVFIKDSRSAKLSEEKGLKRPLMAPRRKNGKAQVSTPIMKKHRRLCWRCCEPFCYGLAAFTIIIALVSLAALVLTIFPIPSLQRIKVWLKHDANTISMEAYGGKGAPALTSYGGNSSKEIVPCTQISVQKLWSRTFPRMNSESPVRKVDLNADGVMDVVFGFGVDDNIQYEGFELPRCKSPQQGDEVPCEGGVIALNGMTGAVLWQSWNVANVFSLLCTLDIDRDGYMDCVAAGRLGMIFAINGRNGNSIWEFREIEVETNSPIVMDLYTINVVRDLDGDEVPDILAAHLEEREESKAGHIKVISGKVGKVIRTIPTPFKEEVFVPLQVITRDDGTEVLLIITGGQTTPGGIYSIRLLSLMEFTSEKAFTPLFRIPHSGLMAPAVITDITGDNVADIVVASFNETVYAFDGRNFSMLWNFSFPRSESVSAIVPGHFNHDNVTDFMIKYNYGPGFPVYYYSQTTILDGMTGKPFLDAMMTDSGGSNSLLGGASISQTFGGDFFLHWQMQCRDKYDAKDAYEFVPDSDIILQARADTCRLRYNTSTVLKLYAIARHIEPPGAVLFSTDDLEVHLNRTQFTHQTNREQQHSKSPLKHPKLLKKLLANREQLLKKVAAGGVAQKHLHTQQSHQRTNADLLRNSMLEQEVLQEILPNNELPYEQQQQLEQQQQPLELHMKQNGVGYSYMGNNAGVGFRGINSNTMGDYEAEPRRIPDEYDTAYNDNEIPELVPPNDHPIRLRTKYPGNRDVRSDINSFEEETNNDTQKSAPKLNVNQNTLVKPVEPLSLWDLEMEKEERDAIKDAATAAATGAGVGPLEDGIHPEETQKRKRDIKPSARVDDSTATDADETANQDANVSDEWFLASISSSGVLLKSLNNTRSSLDFAFVLNIRESEMYPPLFLPQDMKCVNEKTSAYKTYNDKDLLELKKQFLRKCLAERLVAINPEPPKYESQLVITRIGITCTCHTLLANEVCSEFNDVKSQKWTEFMGNDGFGFYRAGN